MMKVDNKFFKVVSDICGNVAAWCLIVLLGLLPFTAVLATIKWFLHIIEVI